MNGSIVLVDFRAAVANISDRPETSFPLSGASLAYFRPNGVAMYIIHFDAVR